jgi:hypothetical protein
VNTGIAHCVGGRDSNFLPLNLARSSGLTLDAHHAGPRSVTGWLTSF